MAQESLSLAGSQQAETARASRGFLRGPRQQSVLFPQAIVGPKAPWETLVRLGCWGKHRSMEDRGGGAGGQSHHFGEPAAARLGKIVGLECSGEHALSPWRATPPRPVEAEEQELLAVSRCQC